MEEFDPPTVDFGEGKVDGLSEFELITDRMPYSESVGFRQEVAIEKDAETGQKRLNGYLLLEEVGEGAFSTVRRVTAPGGKELGLKVYNKIVLAGQRRIDYETGEWTNNLARLEQEVRIWMMLDHVNIARMYEVMEEPGHEKLYILMELGELGLVNEFDYQTRANGLSKRVLAEYASQRGVVDKGAIVREWFGQMVDALEYMHGLGFAHRDIKLENMVVKRNLTFLLIDFNSAKEFGAGSRFSDQEGTLHYHAPECIHGLSEGYSPTAADIWALGVCLYALHFEYLPYDLPPADNEYGYQMDLGIKIRDEAPSYVDPCPPHLLELIQGMLEKDPAKRLTLPQIKASNYMKMKTAV